MHSIQHRTYAFSGRRLFVVSDVHTRIDFLEEALVKASFCFDTDVLIINGDCINRGYGSLKALRYVMKLIQKYPSSVYMIRGNHEDMVVRSIEKFEEHEQDTRYFFEQYDRFIFREFRREAEALGYTMDKFSEMIQFIQYFFKDELSFMKELPISIETEKYLFVHAAFHHLNEEERSYMYTERFLDTSVNPIEKIRVVGHFPTMNYTKDSVISFVRYHENAQILAIDGGIGTHSKTGMLHLVELENDNHAFEERDIYHKKRNEVRCIRNLWSIALRKKVETRSVSKDKEIPLFRIEFYERSFEYDGKITGIYDDYIEIKVGDRKGYMPKGILKDAKQSEENSLCFIRQSYDVLVNTQAHYTAFEHVDVYFEDEVFFYGVTESGSTGYIPKKECKVSENATYEISNQSVYWPIIIHDESIKKEKGNET